MKLQDCFIGQKVGTCSKSKGIITGTLVELFLEDHNWFAIIESKYLDHDIEVNISKLLGVLN